ncbi:hypothetical protein Lal_00011323 [Lupinus albus]|nr:hypothetical protein Lal_00011323 [Lupinus albus]
MDSPYYVHPSESPATTLVSPMLNDKADEICEELRERFSQGKLTKIVELQESTTNLKQGVLSVTSYFTEFKSLWDELDNFIPCPKCTCDALTDIKKCRIEDKIISAVKHGVILDMILRLEETKEDLARLQDKNANLHSVVTFIEKS